MDDVQTEPLVLQIGPMGKGGISAVIDAILSSDLSDSYCTQRIVTTRGKFDFLSIVSATFSILTLREKGAIAHIHMASYGSFLRKEWMARLCGACGIPVILHVHGGSFDEFYHTASPRLQKRIRACFGQARIILLLTDAFVPLLTEIGCADKGVIAPNFAPIPAKRREVFTRTEFQALFMGRIEEAKGVFDLIRAFSMLVEEEGVGQCRLVIAGVGEKDRAEALCEQLGIRECVSFPGWVSGHEKERLFLESDVLALPSYVEAFGLSLVEGMSYGLPVVGCNLPSVSCVVENGKDGILVPPANPEALKDALLFLDAFPKERERMGKTGRAHVAEKYGEALFVERLSRIYREICRQDKERRKGRIERHEK